MMTYSANENSMISSKGMEILISDGKIIEVGSKVSNADQLDNVSAFVIGDGDKWTTTFVPIWAPSDKSNTRVYVGGFLKTSGTDYSWSSDGTKLEFTSAPKLGEEVRLVVLEDQDGRTTTPPHSMMKGRVEARVNENNI